MPPAIQGIQKIQKMPDFLDAVVNLGNLENPGNSENSEGRIYTTRPEGPSLRVGWDGMGHQSVLQFSSYFLGIYNMYIYT